MLRGLQETLVPLERLGLRELMEQRDQQGLEEARVQLVPLELLVSLGQQGQRAQMVRLGLRVFKEFRVTLDQRVPQVILGRLVSKVTRVQRGLGEIPAQMVCQESRVQQGQPE